MLFRCYKNQLSASLFNHYNNFKTNFTHLSNARGDLVDLVICKANYLENWCANLGWKERRRFSFAA